MLKIDEVAKSIAITRWAMPDALHLPISARSKEAISTYIGEIVTELSTVNTDNAFLVNVPPPAEINPRLAIWQIPESKILHQALQV